jgi:hypothetical protein
MKVMKASLDTDAIIHFYRAGLQKCLRLEGSNFRLGGIAPITRAVPSFRVPMRLDISATWQKGN